MEEHQCSTVIISLWATSAGSIHLEPLDVSYYPQILTLIFTHPDNICPLQLGPHLGQFTDEYPSHHILEYCSGGAKQYGFKL